MYYVEGYNYELESSSTGDILIDEHIVIVLRSKLLMRNRIALSCMNISTASTNQ